MHPLIDTTETRALANDSDDGPSPLRRSHAQKTISTGSGNHAAVTQSLRLTRRQEFNLHA